MTQQLNAWVHFPTEIHCMFAEGLSMHHLVSTKYKGVTWQTFRHALPQIRPHPPQSLYLQRVERWLRPQSPSLVQLQTKPAPFPAALSYCQTLFRAFLTASVKLGPRLQD